MIETSGYSADRLRVLPRGRRLGGGSAVTYRCVANLMFLLNVEPDLSESTKSALWDLAEYFPPGTFPVGGSDD